jgi:hypothetical protein
MSKKDLQNKEIDRIGRELLGAARVSDEEIEKIIHAPHIFESVRAGIKKEQSRRKPKRFFNLPVLNWRSAAGAFAILLILAVGAVVILSNQSAQPLTVQIEQSKIQMQIKPSEDLPQITKIEQPETPSVKNPVLARRADFRKDAPKLKNQARKANAAKQPQSIKEEGAFYALGGNWEADAEDLQIVRAELSRAELFALGVNLPVENETPKIKTDLLVGAGGVPRAIRFVE